jgi:hypothetical protein
MFVTGAPLKYQLFVETCTSSPNRTSMNGLVLFILVASFWMAVDKAILVSTNNKILIPVFSVCLCSYLDLTLTSTTKIKNKTLRQTRFPIVNFPFISSNIPASSAYGVYISQRLVSHRDKKTSTYKGKDPLSFKIWIFHNGQPDCNDDRSIVIFPNELEAKDTMDT